MKLRIAPDVFWHTAVPFAACVVLAFAWGVDLGWGLLTLAAVALIAAVGAAVHHAEVIALRVGEPFGTLVLALAVTVIEVALIVALMLSDPVATSALARDTVFATVMIICNGVVGLCLLLGALRHHVLAFQVEGTSSALAVLATLATLILVVPSFTSTVPGPILSTSQLVFAAVVSLTLYLVFIFVQTVRHREYFLPVESGPEARVAPPTAKATLLSLALLLVALVAVVGLAKSIAPDIEAVVQRTGVPHAAVGVAIALMVLLPETWAAVRAARANRLQTSMNLAIGSALACIGLTVPVVVLAAAAFELPLVLGLEPKDMAMLVLTFLVSAVTLGTGRTYLMQGAVHLVLFAAFLFLAFVP